MSALAKPQRSLKAWGDQKWRTKSGKKYATKQSFTKYVKIFFQPSSLLSIHQLHTY